MRFSLSPSGRTFLYGVCSLSAPVCRVSGHLVWVCAFLCRPMLLAWPLLAPTALKSLSGIDFCNFWPSCHRPPDDRLSRAAEWNLTLYHRLAFMFQGNNVWANICLASFQVPFDYGESNFKVTSTPKIRITLLAG
jgi:hypothetical protein